MEDFKEKYEQALERAKNYHKGHTLDVNPQAAMEYIFPELKGNKDENDEIKRKLIEALKECSFTHFNDEFTVQEALTWLEKRGEMKPQGNSVLEVWKDMRLEVYQQASGNRHESNCSDDSTKMFSLTDIDEIFEKVDEKQGEQKPANNAEPKFKVGNWVIWDNKISCHIDNIYQGKNSLMYTVTDTNNMTRSYSVKGFDNNAHLWTIQDAKDGDVLSSKDAVFIFKHMDKAGLSLCRSYCEVIGNSKLGFGFDFSINGVRPASKKQRDLLFSKMREAGYEWNPESRELKQIGQTPTPIVDDWVEEYWQHNKVNNLESYDGGEEIQFDHDGFMRFCKMYCKKSAWNEEDESHIGRTLSYLESFKAYNIPHIEPIKKEIDWLKSLKEKRIWKPSKEQIIALRWVLNNVPYNKHKEEISGLLDQIKNL